MTGPYDRINVGNGQVLNRRSLALHNQAITVFHVLGGKSTPRIAQGSYTTGVSASGNTHKGGGAEDTTLPSTASNGQWMLWQKAQRFCGGAAFNRPELVRDGKRIWGHHNHCGWLGDKQASPELVSQFRDYYAHRDGLADHAPDNTWHPSHIFVPRYPLGVIDLSNVVAEANKTRGFKSLPGVKQFQKALNVKIGADLTVDGIYGRKTKIAVAHWENVVGGNGDGIPGEFSSVLLGAGFFNVKL